MPNCCLAFPDYSCLTEVYAPAISGGSWSSSLPAANLLDKDIYKYARSTSAAAINTQFSIDYGQTRIARFIGLLKHNLTDSATVRIIAYTDAAKTQVAYDTGWIAAASYFFPPGVFSADMGRSAGGYLTSAERGTLRSDFWLVLPTHISLRAVYVQISDTANPAGFVDLARCFVAPVWQPPVGVSYGASIGWETDATVTRPSGGRKVITETYRWRVTDFQIEGITREVAAACVLDMQRRLGKKGELYYVHNPDDVYGALRMESFLGNLDELSPLNRPYFNAYDTAFRVTEVI